MRMAQSVVRVALIATVPKWDDNDLTRRLVRAHATAEPRAQKAPSVARSTQSLYYPDATHPKVAGTALARRKDMPKRVKRSRKPTASKVSKKMADVRPLRADAAIGRRYELGFKPPREKDPWVDEGRPEENG
jgi:hypothetical protein